MNLRLKSSRKAFTLIELMVVIVIIVLIALSAVGSYAGVQKQARLDFAADSLISMIKEQLGFARSGFRAINTLNDQASDQNNVGKLQCFALKFQIDSKESVQIAQSSYNAIGKESEGQAGKVDFCDPIGDQQWVTKDFIGDGLTLKAIRQKSTLLGGEAQLINEPLELYFKPPFGKVYRKVGDKFMPIQDQFYYFELGYNDNNASAAQADTVQPVSDQNHRVIEYNVQSKVVRKI